MNIWTQILYKWTVKKYLPSFGKCISDFSIFLIAQSFIKVGLDGIQEIWRVDVMFIQLTPER